MMEIDEELMEALLPFIPDEDDSDVEILGDCLGEEDDIDVIPREEFLSDTAQQNENEREPKIQPTIEDDIDIEILDNYDVEEDDIDIVPREDVATDTAQQSEIQPSMQPTIEDDSDIEILDDNVVEEKRKSPSPREKVVVDSLRQITKQQPIQPTSIPSSKQLQQGRGKSSQNYYYGGHDNESSSDDDLPLNNDADRDDDYIEEASKGLRSKRRRGKVSYRDEEDYDVASSESDSDASGQDSPEENMDDEDDEDEVPGTLFNPFQSRKKGAKSPRDDSPDMEVVEEEPSASLVDLGDATDEDEVPADVDGEALKKLRLQKLLTRMDRIVNNINASMAKFMEKEAAAAAAAASAAAIAEEGSCNSAEGAKESRLDMQSVVSDPSKLAARMVELDHRAAAPSTSGSVLLSKSCNLRDYQQGGVEWLCSLHNQRLNGILADEMGLGKTLQVLAFLCALWERKGIWGPHLIVMPMSVISSWKGDLKRFCNAEDINIHIHHGLKEDRHRDFESWRKRTFAAKVRGRGRPSKAYVSSNCRWKISLVLTTYDLSIKDLSLFQKIGRGPCRWSYLVVDEAHRLKNRASILFGALERTNASRRLLLTGTPLQNNLGELWSLLSFILPDIFKDVQQFADWFNSPFKLDEEEDGLEKDAIDDDGTEISSAVVSDSKLMSDSTKALVGSSILSAEERGVIVSSLHRVMKPFLLRRLKADVVLDMPLKIERTVYCPFTGLQKQVYDVIKSFVEKQSARFTTGTASRDPFLGDCEEDLHDESFLGNSLFKYRAGVSFHNVLMHLRRLCNHPFLLLEDMKSIPDELYYKYLVTSSGKMCMLERLLQILIPRGHKVLIFSQMTTTLDILQGYINEAMGITCCRLDGNTSTEAREEQLHAFNNPQSNQSLPVFLLSTRAGGVGINLQAADTVIFFDSDWNPQQDLQAMSRAHRLGQTKTVLVLRLVTVGAEKSTVSVEERILRRAAQKLAAERVVLADGEFDMGTCNANKIKFSDGSSFGNPLTAKEENLMSLFSARDVEADVDLASLDTEASEGSGSSGGTTSSSRSESSIMDGSSSEKSGSMLDKFDRRRPEHKVDHVNLEPQAIVAVCTRPLASSNESSISDTAFPEICRLISANCTEPMAEYGSSMDVVLDWCPWLGVPDGLQHKVMKARKRSRIDAFKPAASSLNQEMDYCEDEAGRITRSGRRVESPSRKPSRASPNNRASHNRRGVGESEAKSDVYNNSLEAACGEEMQPLADDDICVLCQRTLASEADYATVAGMAGTTRPVGAMLDAEREEVLLICDSCNCAYHVACVGLYEVPPDDWFCQFCKSLREHQR